MPATTFPRHHLASLHEYAARLLDIRTVGRDHEPLARDLLAGFYEVCMRSGLDGILAELAQAHSLELTDGSVLAEHAELRRALVERLDDKAQFDPGGPRNAKPGQLADCVLAVLSLEVVDEPDQTITLADAVRGDVIAALASVLDAELAMAHVRETIITTARASCEPRFLAAFDKLAAQLDELGLRIVRQPKVPLEAVQAVQQVLADTRSAIYTRAAQTAIDRAKAALEATDAEAAARIDRPITLRLTPRDVAIERAIDPRVPKAAEAVARTLFESLSELCHLAWQPVEQPVRTYAASQTFAVGDLLDHPKFGRGAVLSTATQRIEVEFPDGKHTLVHGRG